MFVFSDMGAAMSDKADKRIPIIERIAQLFGGTTYRAELSSRGVVNLTQSDIAACLGAVGRDNGTHVSKALETYVASTTRHVEPLIRAWMDHRGTPQNMQKRSIMRFGAWLALREIAGEKLNSTTVVCYKTLIGCDRKTLEIAVDQARSWYWDLIAQGITEFRRQALGDDEPRTAAIGGR